MGFSHLRSKICTAAVSVKPPAASITPHNTSKPIHRPQGNWSLRLVERPRPSAKRTTVAYAAPASSPINTIFQKVSRNFISSSLSGLFFRIFFRLGRGHLFPPVRYPPHSSQHDSAQRHEVGNPRKHAVGKQRQRIAGQF